MMDVPIKDIQIVGNIREGEVNVTDLIESIRRWGVIVPLVCITDDNGGYQLVAGHRRLAAAIGAGLDMVPVVVTEYIETPADRTAIQYHENVMREDLTAWEEAQATLDLREEGMSVAEVAVELGESQREVARRIKVAKTFETVDDKDTVQSLTHEALFELADADMPVSQLVQALEMVAGGESTRYGIQIAQRQAQMAHEEEETARLTVLAREAGARFVDEQPKRGEQLVQWRNGEARFTNNLGFVEDDIVAHRHEDCHVYWVMQAYNGEILTEWCKSPARHREKGKSPLKEADAVRKAEMKLGEKEDRKVLREAKRARMDTVKSILGLAKWRQADVLAELVPSVVLFSHDTARVLAKALDLPEVASPYGSGLDYPKMLDAWLEGLPVTKQAMARIVAVAAATYIDRSPYATVDKTAATWFDERTVEQG